MHNIEVEQFSVGNAPTMVHELTKLSAGYSPTTNTADQHHQQYRYGNLKRKFTIQAADSMDDPSAHLPTKTFKSSTDDDETISKDNHLHHHNHQEIQTLIDEHHHQHHHQLDQHHQIMNSHHYISDGLVEPQDIVIEFTGDDQTHHFAAGADTNVEYVNIMFDSGLLPVQQNHQIISEPNYYTEEELNGSNWNNVDLLDLDQRHLFFETATTTTAATTMPSIMAESPETQMATTTELTTMTAATDVVSPSDVSSNLADSSMSSSIIIDDQQGIVDGTIVASSQSSSCCNELSAEQSAVESDERLPASE